MMGYENVRPAKVSVQRVLALIPRRFDRVPVDRRDYNPPKDQLGLVPDEVAEHLPEIVRKGGGVEYDKLTVALLAVVRNQERRIASLEERLKDKGSDA